MSTEFPARRCAGTMEAMASMHTPANAMTAGDGTAS